MFLLREKLLFFEKLNKICKNHLTEQRKLLLHRSLISIRRSYVIADNTNVFINILLYFGELSPKILITVRSFHKYSN